jgi:hypothetical protein
VEPLHHVIRPHLAQKEFHARDAFPKGVQYGREGFVRGRRYEPQRQSPDLPVADTLNRADGLIQLHKYPRRFLQQQLASLGQPYSTVGPLEQPYPKFLFQLLYLVAQRRLRDVKPFGCAAKARFLGHHDEVA